MRLPMSRLCQIADWDKHAGELGLPSNTLDRGFSRAIFSGGTVDFAKG
jgi:hypothetical protein